jgi:hypothetical protein
VTNHVALAVGQHPISALVVHMIIIILAEELALLVQLIVFQMEQEQLAKVVIHRALHATDHPSSNVCHVALHIINY